MQKIVRENPTNTFIELVPFAAIVDGEVNHPWQITELWSDAELAEIGVYRVAVNVPDGEMLTAYSFSRVNGAVQAILVTEDIPLAPVTPLQMRKALSQAGLRQAVEDFVNAADLTTQDAWQYATIIERDNPLIAACGAALGKNDAEIDALFALAATL